MPGERETVVVTGAAGGVGRATARAFGRRGANVGLLARGVEGLEAAAREVAQEGGAALVLPKSPPRRSRTASARSTSGSIARWRRSFRRSPI
jgi:NAD(P)-dependent dehydrogenase (short-subunit alcohol dehydrogenase family)